MFFDYHGMHNDFIPKGAMISMKSYKEDFVHTWEEIHLKPEVWVAEQLGAPV
jgi:hypothetical protein